MSDNFLNNDIGVRAFINSAFEGVMLSESSTTTKYKRRTLDIITDYFSRKGELFNAEQIEEKFRNIFFHSNHTHQNLMRLEPILMNIALGLGFAQDDVDVEKIQRLFHIVQYMKMKFESIKKNEFIPPIDISKMTLDNTSFESLDKTWGSMMDEERKREEENVKKYDWESQVNPAYEVFADIDYETANEYGEYSGARKGPFGDFYGRICYTVSEQSWEDFTDYGRNKVYLFLRDDFDDVPCEYGENHPYDDYGLSMIFVIVGPDGYIEYSNTRWNHETENMQYSEKVDHAFSKEDLSRILGINVNRIFGVDE